MTRRFLILSLAVGLLALGGLNAQAGLITLPTTFDTLEPSGNYATVGNLKFSDFAFSASAIPSSTPVLPASEVTVSPFNTIPGQTGIGFGGAFIATAGTTVDYQIGYLVTALSGSITNANLTLVGGAIGTGLFSVSETLTNAANGAFLGSLEGSSPGTTSTSWSPGVTSILVSKDIVLVGGSGLAYVSNVEGYSATAIPEPASMVLFGIGLSGLFAFRRFLKRTSVA